MSEPDKSKDEKPPEQIYNEREAVSWVVGTVGFVSGCGFLFLFRWFFSWPALTKWTLIGFGMLGYIVGIGLYELRTYLKRKRRSE